ncbi:MAG TPA: response regulator [Selenomonadales bacterium]|nr:response regulator [Selenomonadales bacterium]
MAAKELSVLICDDSMLIRKKMRDLLEANDYQVLEAQNGLEGVEVYRQTKPAVVFMDIVMPQSDGLQALKQIKQFDPQAKVIMLSSTGTATKLVEALKSGAVDFIQKPYEKDHILTALAKASQ